MAPRKWRALGFARRRRVARHRPENGHPLRIAVGGNDLMSERLDRLAANRSIQELNRVHHWDLPAVAFQSRLKVYQPTRISLCHPIALTWPTQPSLPRSHLI